jgi:hypothetical protein
VRKPTNALERDISKELDIEMISIYQKGHITTHFNDH